LLGVLSVLLFSLSLLIGAAAVGLLRPQVSGSGTVSFSGFNGIGVVSGFVFIFAGAIALGPQFGIPLLLALLLHELGQVLGYRMLGHENACFRLVPWFNSAKISDQPLKSDGEVFLASIMGPAFNLAPMAISMTLALGLSATHPVAANWLWMFGATVGAVNFISLLPFLPLNGGRCTQAAVKNFWPALAPAMNVFMCAALASASIRTGSVALMVMAGIGAQGLLRKSRTTQSGMKSDDGLIALAAYAFTMAAHFSAGWLLFEAYF
jgi:hypothetical protein